MAEDLHKEGFEEDKKQNSGSKDDDDFGLPDLEFEELEELDLDLDDGLNDISSPDELAALGMADEDDGNSSDSLFAADDNASSDSDVFGSDSDSEFEGGSIFASDTNLKEEEKMEFESADDAELPPT